MHRKTRCTAILALALTYASSCAVCLSDEQTSGKSAATQTQSHSTNVKFKTHDGIEMFGRLVLPPAQPPRAIVIYVQTAEGATVDQKRPLRDGETFNYFDLYREEFVGRNIGFFSYEGRGIRMGDKPPRFEEVDRAIYDTSTLDNKVRDAISAVETVQKQKGLKDTPILLMGASEGTLIAAEAASRIHESIDGLVLYGVLANNMNENFRYIMTGGSFLPYLPLDKNFDGSVSKEEWEAAIKDVDFSKADTNGDGEFKADDFEIVNKKYVDAIDNRDFQVLNEWSKSSAGVALPRDWFKDHFSHADLWSFLKTLDIPVGLFHGDKDNMASMPALKNLQATAKSANYTNLEFYYFEGLDHTLNIAEYFVKDTIPKGHQAIFDYVDRIVPRN